LESDPNYQGAASFALASRFKLTPCSAAWTAKARWTSIRGML